MTIDYLSVDRSGKSRHLKFSEGEMRPVWKVLQADLLQGRLVTLVATDGSHESDYAALQEYLWVRLIELNP